MPPPTNYEDAVRLVPFRNTTAEEIPARSVLRPTGYEDGEAGPLLTIAKPNENGGRGTPVNWDDPVPANGYGNCTFDLPVKIAHETADGDPAVGQLWESRSGSWTLHRSDVPSGVIAYGALGTFDGKALFGPGPVLAPAGSGGGTKLPYSGARITRRGSPPGFDTIRWDTDGYAFNSPDQAVAQGGTYNCFKIPRSGYYAVGAQWRSPQVSGFLMFLVWYPRNGFMQFPVPKVYIACTEDGFINRFGEVVTHWYFRQGDLVAPEVMSFFVDKIACVSPEFWIFYVGDGPVLRDEDLAPEFDWQAGGDGQGGGGIKPGGGGLKTPAPGGAPVGGDPKLVSFLLSQNNWDGLVLKGEATTTGLATATALTVPINDGTTTFLDIAVVGRQTGGSVGNVGDGISYRAVDAFRNVGGTLTRIGSPPPVGATVLHSTNDDNASAGFYSASLTGATVEIKVTGNTNRNYTWAVMVRRKEV